VRPSRHAEKVAAACTFLDGALGPHRTQLDIDVPIDDIIRQHRLKVRSAPGNGHCLLYSWAAATNTSVDHVKRLVRDEYTGHAVNYNNAGTDAHEMQRYLSSRTYTLDAVDAVIHILCNACAVTAFVIGQKYTYNNPQNVTAVPGVTEIRRICGRNSAASQRQILLLKTMEHYDSLA